MQAVKPDWDSKALVSDIKAVLVKASPEECVKNDPVEGALVVRYAFIARMGQRDVPDFL